MGVYTRVHDGVWHSAGSHLDRVRIISNVRFACRTKLLVVTSTALVYGGYHLFWIGRWRTILSGSVSGYLRQGRRGATTCNGPLWRLLA